MKLLFKWMVCVVTLLAAFEIFPGAVTARGGVLTIVIAASILWLVNIIIRPLVQLVSFPLTLLTFGIFSLVVNAAMVSLVDIMMPNFKIHSFWLCLLIALVVSFANTVVAAKSHKAG
jgi:putative membrane protein